MNKVDAKYRSVILEALDDYLYKVSMELNELKGHAMNNRRKELTKKQRLIEDLRRDLNSSE